MFKKIKHRGPDASKIRYYKDNFMVGFHRLAIVDSTDDGMQPFENDRYICVVNGEIYNYKELKEKYDLKTESYSDCEVVSALFRQINEKDEDTIWYDKLTQLCYLLDGEFTFVILDLEKDIIYYGVDELRTRPLFLGTDDTGIYLTSEQKSLNGCNFISAIDSGDVGYFTGRLSDNNFKFDKYKYFNFEKPATFKYSEDLLSMVSIKLNNLLTESVIKKIDTEKECGFLLSGGLDSSLICSIASKHLYPRRIRTFTIGFDPNASDVLAAAEVAKYIGSIHTTFIVNFKDGIDVLSDIVGIMETWDQTSLRAGNVMYLLLKKIKKKHPEIVVILSGELSDELFMGYLEWKNIENLTDARNHVIKRLKHVTYFDGLRADRVVTSVGCELRLPFFDKKLLNFVLDLDPQYFSPISNNNIEKFILRKAFEKDYLPTNILWRTKNAFSDATSIIGENSWKEFLKTYAEESVTNSRFDSRFEIYSENTPQTKEDMLYRDIFDSYEYEHSCIPYKWMSYGSTGGDSSATSLSVFTSNY